MDLVEEASVELNSMLKEKLLLTLLNCWSFLDSYHTLQLFELVSIHARGPFRDSFDGVAVLLKL